MEINTLVQFKDANIRIQGTKEEPLFCGKDVCEVLGLNNNRQAIYKIPHKYRVSFQMTTSGGAQQMVFLKEPALYMLIMKSRKPQAAPFQEWVCGEVLPCIRKHGCYPAPEPELYDKNLLKVETEFDLQVAVINYIREYTSLHVITSLGENQDTRTKRIRSKMLGYEKGTPDIIIPNPTSRYNGLAIELKTPQGTGCLSDHQTQQLELFEALGSKTIVSNNLLDIVHTLTLYDEAVKLYCPQCRKAFKSMDSRLRHERRYHSHRCTLCNVQFEKEIGRDIHMRDCCIDVEDGEEGDVSEYTISYESDE